MVQRASCLQIQRDFPQSGYGPGIDIFPPVGDGTVSVPPAQPTFVAPESSYSPENCILRDAVFQIPPSVKDGYQVVIDVPMAQWSDDNSVNVTESEEVPDGYLKAYVFTTVGSGATTPTL